MLTSQIKTSRLFNLYENEARDSVKTKDNIKFVFSFSSF